MSADTQTTAATEPVLQQQQLPASPPLTRDYSPSPSTSPTPALLACPPLDRCFSTNSSNSEYSRLSSGSRSSTGSAAAAAARRRGYVRPQGASFADSARNRDSVMSLGSIAHLQYYFARTGILDGKGGQLAREDPNNTNKKKKMKRRSEQDGPLIADTTQPPDLTSPITAESEISQSPVDEFDPQSGDWDDPFMLPPTVSTYNHRSQYVPPPPDIHVLRNELKSSLGHVSKAMADVNQSEEEQQQQTTVHPDPSVDDGAEQPGQRSPNRGWHEIQGTHVLDVVTLAIKAAREYYLMHDQPQLLTKVKSERAIREELFGVMDVLKRMALRNFAGGIRAEETASIATWVAAVEDFLCREKEVEDQERRDRESWTWLDGDWSGRERLREWEFMRTFAAEEDAELPPWDDPRTAADDDGKLPTRFLRALASGLVLVHLHNRILKKSKRQYARIDAYHTDFAVPYRAADNLRYWVKAAEIRWEIKLKVDVMSVVYDKEQDAWAEFDRAVMQWCRAVREEITREWKTGNVQVSLPELRYD